MCLDEGWRSTPIVRASESPTKKSVRDGRAAREEPAEWFLGT